MQMECPVSGERVNERVVRTVAALVLFLLLGAFFLDWSFVFAFLAIDFVSRSAGSGSYSLLRLLAQRLVKWSGAAPRWTDAAPKKFAAGAGAFFSVLMFVCMQLEWKWGSIITASVFGICALLESAAGFCVGCYVYTSLRRFGLIAR